LNNKRGFIADLEKEHGVQVLILPDGRLRPDEYEFEMEGVRDTKKQGADGATVETARQPEPRPASAPTAPAPSNARSPRKSSESQGPRRAASER
jgi:hypothetical protein